MVRPLPTPREFIEHREGTCRTSERFAAIGRGRSPESLLHHDAYTIRVGNTQIDAAVDGGQHAYRELVQGSCIQVHTRGHVASSGTRSSHPNEVPLPTSFAQCSHHQHALYAFGLNK